MADLSTEVTTVGNDMVDLMNKSHIFLELAKIPNALYIPLGLLAIIFNVLAFAVIYSSKALHTKCFALIAVNCVSDFLLGVGYAAVGSIRLYRHYSGVGEVISMWRCCFEVSLIAFAQIFSLAMNTILVMDRLLAVYCPVRYKQWTYNQVTIPLLAAAILGSLAQLAVHFHNSWIGAHKMLKTCGIEDTLFPNPSANMIILQIAMSGVIVLFNGVLGIGVWQRRKTFQNGTSAGVLNQQDNQRLRNDMKIVKVVVVIVIMHVCTHLAGRFAIYLVDAVDAGDEAAKTLTNRYGRELTVFNASIQFFLLLATSRQFRIAARKMFKRKTNVVSVVVGTVGQAGAVVNATSFNN